MLLNFCRPGLKFNIFGSSQLPPYKNILFVYLIKSSRFVGDVPKLQQKRNNWFMYMFRIKELILILKHNIYLFTVKFLHNRVLTN